MYYITTKQPVKWTQVSLEDFLNGVDSVCINNSNTGTITYERDYITDRFSNRIDVTTMIDKLRFFNTMTDVLRSVPRKSLYREFSIPKKSGGLRKIDAPNDMLKATLRSLKDMFENDFHALYHTSAYAYIHGRSILDAMKKHQANESVWFAKFDLTNFFGSITLDFTMQMLSMVFPFCCIMEDSEGEKELRKAVELGFLNGGLPQGTPLSPTLTNIIMIPIDFKLNKALQDMSGMFCYTRYADDFQISCKHPFNYKKVEHLIVNTLRDFNAPMRLKHEKTRYGSNAGSNWNLGLMLNKNNDITVGHETKKKYQAMLASFIMDTLNGNPWDASEVRVLNGHRNYYKQIEGAVIDRITYHVGKKFNVDPIEMINKALNVQ